MTDKEQALTIYIMILSVLRWVDKPSPRVVKLSNSIYKQIRKHHLKCVKGSSVRKASKEYIETNDSVIEAWDTTRRELVNEDAPIVSSTSEIIQMLWDRISSNKYQDMYCSDKKMQGVINSIAQCKAKEDYTNTEVTQFDNNSRALANRFMELAGIPKRHNLSTRLAIQKSNLICEGRM
jgi:hypothetical protein